MIVVERALSLTQPWATLMAIDAKRVETRSWSMSFRGWVAIHASKGFPQECQWVCYQKPFAGALGAAGFNTAKDLPRGQIIAIAEIYDCRPTYHVGHEINEERAFGDYSHGRYAIFTRGVRRLKWPIQVKGALGLWRLHEPLQEGRDF